MAEDKKKVVFITGAARGIGLAIAERFVRDGNRVYMTDIDGEEAVRQAKRLSSAGFDACGGMCDVTNEGEISGWFKRLKQEEGRVDVVVNNAGLQYVARIEDFPVEQFDKMIGVMLRGPFIITKYVLPLMKMQRFGRIINVSSINGLIGFAGKAAYNSAKHGLIGLTKVTALEAAEYGICVNAICPGYVDTPLVRNQLGMLAQTRGIPEQKVLEEVIYPLVPQKRLLEVEEIASAVSFLASEETKGMTGQTLVLDGGYTAC